MSGNRGAGLGGLGGRLVIVAFDPGETTGWSWLAVSKESALRKGTQAALREARPDVELETLEPEVADMDLGMDHGQFGKGEGLSEDQMVDKMMALTRRCTSVFKVDFEAGDTFAVVTEDFILRQMSMDRNLLAPVRLNAKFERDLRGVGLRFHLQSPSDAKNVVTDARLRLWNVYESASGVHSRDADRHAILFMRRWASQVHLRKSLGSGAPRQPGHPQQRTA